MKRALSKNFVRFFIFIAVFFTLILFVFSDRVRVFGWGAGHDTVGRSVAIRLPAAWRDQLKGPILARFLNDNHFPDSREALNDPRFDQEDKAVFAQYKFKDRFAFHTSLGRSIAFERLVDAIRKDDADRVFLFLAVLCHSIADQTACNHEPFIHYATYNLGAEGMNILGKVPLDLGWIDQNANRQALFEQALADLPESLPAAEPDKIHQDLAFYEWEGTESFRRAADLFKKAVRCSKESVNPDDEKDLVHEFACLGAWSVKRILYVFASASEFARSGKDARYDSRYLNDYSNKINRYLKDRPIEMESFAVPYLPHRTTAVKIAVLYNPVGKMNEGMFNFLNRVQGCQICHTLKDRYEIALWDLRRFLDCGFNSTEWTSEPKTSSLPELLIIPAQNCVNYYFMKTDNLYRRISEYLQTGGKILWIGTIPPDIVSPGLSKLVRQNNEKDDYYNPVYPVSINQLMLSRIRTADGKNWAFTHLPKGKAGWIWPRCRYYFDEPTDREFKPVLYLDPPKKDQVSPTIQTDQMKRKVIGLVRPVEHPNFGWLPSYAVFPYLLTKEKPDFQDLDLSLDSADKAILRDMLDALEISAKK